MFPNICHIYGPFYVNCYGLAICLGILVFMFLTQKNKKLKNLISNEQFKNAIIFGIIFGIIGGRILWAITDWQNITTFIEIFKIWEPGFSSLGTLIGILIFIPFYLKKINVPILPLLDIVAIYIPLLHSISRIGCFLAGCCHGIQTNSIFGIVYTHPKVMVPENLKFIPIHPTQLYSSFSLFIIFLIMYFILQHKLNKQGQLLAAYLTFASIERFFNDFFRNDRDFYNINFFNYFSIDQWIALVILLFAISLAIYSKLKTHTKEKICNYESI